MAPRRNDLTLTVHAPALVNGDHRPSALVRAMETALGDSRLDWTISDEGELIRLPQRDVWIAQGRVEGPGLPLVCNGSDESSLVTVYGLQTSAVSGPAGQPSFDVHADLPMDDTHLAVVAEVLEAIARSANAYWGHATPFQTTVEISQQTTHPTRKPRTPPRGLPALQFREYLRSPELPHRLGWMNYWSATTARSLGFPDPSRDEDLLSRSRSTETGAWVVQLTDAPLDLDQPAHLAALVRAYDRFPEIGGRTP